MAHSGTNSRIAQSMTNMHNSIVPSFFRPTFLQIMLTFMDPQLRAAFGLPTPNRFLATTVFLALRVRSCFIKHCMLPRFNPLNIFQANEDGSTSVVYWMVQPWYVPATFW